MRRTLVRVVAVLVVLACVRPVSVQASHTPAPASVTLAGDLQTEVGCSSDWDPSCTASRLTYDAADDVWQRLFSLPAGTYEYKVALNDAWAENYGAGGTPSGPGTTLSLGAPTAVKFYYSHATHWITDAFTSTVPVAAGDFQSELGCPGDWQPDCLRSWLQDPDANGVATFATDALPAGTYQVKVAHDESWAESYGAGGAPGGGNIVFDVPASATVTFSYDLATHVLTVDAATASGSIDVAELRHDSRDPLYRDPPGSQPAGSTVTLRLRAASGDLTAATVRVETWGYEAPDGLVRLLAMTKAADDGQHEWWEVDVPSPASPSIVRYAFVGRDGEAAVHYEDDGQLTGGAGAPYPDSPGQPWTIAFHDPAFDAPDWMAEGVAYHIEVDRFRNGDASNDTPAGSFFYGEPGGTIRRSNAGAWNTPLCDPRDAAVCPGAFDRNEYGGDLQGVIERLDALQTLGVSVVSLSPVFDSPSDRKLDASDVHTIDASLGGLASFQALVAEAHARGIRIVIQAPFAHTSSDSPLFDRFGRHGAVGACESASSPTRGWYAFEAAAPPSGGMCATEATFRSSMHLPSQPRLDAADSDVRDHIWAHPTGSALGRWGQGLAAVDGWWLVNAGEVETSFRDDFWEGFRHAAKGANPDAYLFGEHAIGDERGRAERAVLGSEWDAVGDDRLSTALLGFFRDEPYVDPRHGPTAPRGPLVPLGPSELNERLLDVQERYPPEARSTMLNMLSGPDDNRPAFLLDHNTDVGDPASYRDPGYDWSDALHRLKGAALLLFTIPGVPTVLYGDEVGLAGPVGRAGDAWASDPFGRQPYPWLDETGTPFYSHLATAQGQDGMRSHYATLAATRGMHPALRSGTFDPLLVDDGADLYAFGRRMPDLSDAAVVVVNRSATTRPATVDVDGYLPAGATLVDVLDGGAAHTVAASGTITVDVPGEGGVLLVPSGAMPSAPGTVVNLSVSGVGAGHVDLAWDPVPGATGYDVLRSLVSGGGFAPVASTTGTNFTDVAVQPGVAYHYVVRARHDPTRLVGSSSHEVTAVPQHDMTAAWFNVQFPSSLAHTISATSRTGAIFGQVWVNGVTEAVGQGAGIRAQVGFGPTGTAPSVGWTWSEMGYAGDVGNNDEYVGSLLPDALGTFDYATRFSGDGGRTWFVTDLDGPPYSSAQAGTLTVSASSDTMPPSQPVLATETVRQESVTLSWTPSTDDVAVSGYELFRDGDLIATLAGDADRYTDEAVTPGTTHRYAMRAFDSSFNRSPVSSPVDVTPAARAVAVEFRVAVPATTPPGSVVHLAVDDETVGQWDPGAVPMTPQPDGTWSTTLIRPEGTRLRYRFTRGTWETREEWGSIRGVHMRGPVVVAGDDDGRMVLDHTTADAGPDAVQPVGGWKDPWVVSSTPASGATDVSPSTTVTLQWSNAMQPDVTLGLNGPGGPVGGTPSYDASTRTLSFQPGTPLASGSYAIEATGQRDAGWNVQQLAFQASFEVGGATPNRPPAAVADGFSTDEDVALTVPAPGVLANDGDPDGDDLHATLETPPGRGTLDLRPDGSFVYVPDADAHGTDSFTYRASDGARTSAPVAVVIAVDEVNDAPHTADDAATTPRYTPVTIDVLANDDDVDGDPLSVVEVSAPGHGTATIEDDGSVTYSPDGGFVEGDTFDYTVDDGRGGRTIATVVVEAQACSLDSTLPSLLADAIALASPDLAGVVYRLACA